MSNFGLALVICQKSTNIHKYLTNVVKYIHSKRLSEVKTPMKAYGDLRNNQCWYI